LSGGGVNEIFEILDDDFINTVIGRFTTMRTDFSLAYKRQQ